MPRTAVALAALATTTLLTVVTPVPSSAATGVLAATDSSTPVVHHVIWRNPAPGCYQWETFDQRPPIYVENSTNSRVELYSNSQCVKFLDPFKTLAPGTFTTIEQPIGSFKVLR
ncbi:hypothetical protein [Streptomyces orinoci]|uniref:Uncharacterized protein n=1 Tax=Streptomyces orinoci TaxID=67339 RepID=A0ABV3K503_STRON|nr:hypothetical protein [Streptomyces orinoci]